MVGHAILTLCRSPKSREVDEFCNWHIIAYNKTGEVLDTPDYALDKHTKRGKALGRGMKHFWEVGSKLENDVGEHTYLPYILKFNGIDEA